MHTNLHNEIEEHKGSDILSDVFLWIFGIVFVLGFVYIIASTIYGEERVDEVVADLIVDIRN